MNGEILSFEQLAAETDAGTMPEEGWEEEVKTPLEKNIEELDQRIVAETDAVAKEKLLNDYLNLLMTEVNNFNIPGLKKDVIIERRHLTDLVMTRLFNHQFTGYDNVPADDKTRPGLRSKALDMKIQALKPFFDRYLELLRESGAKVEENYQESDALAKLREQFGVRTDKPSITNSQDASKTRVKNVMREVMSVSDQTTKRDVQEGVAKLKSEQPVTYLEIFKALSQERNRWWSDMEDLYVQFSASDVFGEANFNYIVTELEFMNEMGVDVSAMVDVAMTWKTRDNFGLAGLRNRLQSLTRKK